MKKIFRFVFTAVALLSLIPLAKGEGEGATTPQKGPDYYLNADGSIGYMKKISEPNTQGIYTITLESFATGSSVKLLKSVPADIVLVLDVSGSMASNMAGGTATSSNPSRLSIMKEAVNKFIDKIDENDRIDPITNKVRAQRLGNRIAIVAYSGPRSVDDESPTADNSIKLNTGWRTLGNNQNVEDYTGRDYLKNTAVDGLTASGGTFSNFGMEAAKNLVSGLDPDRTLRTVVMFTDGDPGRGTYWVGRGENGYATTTVGNGSNRRTVLTNNYGIYTWNTANGAIGYANDIKNLATEAISSKVFTVSIINNPSSYTTVYLDQVSSNYSNADKMAELLPYNYSGTRYYYIDNWNTNADWTARTGEKVATKYALQASNPEELYNIFDTIAEDSGGGSEDLGEATIAQVDVVSASFMLPGGTDPSQVKIYISKVSDTQDPTPKTYIDDDNNTQSEDFLEFDPPVSSDQCTYTYTKIVTNDDGTTEEYPNTNVAEAISVEFDEENPNKVVVSGFDYGAHWCGPRYDLDGETLLGWHGYKLIVQIPIKMDPNAVGGPDVATNAEGSGVIVNGVNVAPFRSPQVSLPVNIHIRKEGLDVGESAKFSIERKKVSDPETAWVEVSNVFVTRHKGQDINGANAPICKVVGMPSVDEGDNELVYRVVEQDWNWSYTLTTIKSADGTTIGNVGTRSATTAELVTNPFIFVNSKKTGIDQQVRHAESKATNTFKTGLTKNAEYDDSKNNGRPVIEK